MASAPISTLSDDDFEVMRARFIAVGDHLTDLQLLDLADSYHEMLRQRRVFRTGRREVASADPVRIGPEDRTF